MNSLLILYQLLNCFKTALNAGNINFVLQMKVIGQEKETKELKETLRLFFSPKKGVNDDMKYRRRPIQSN